MLAKKNAFPLRLLCSQMRMNMTGEGIVAVNLSVCIQLFSNCAMSFHFRYISKTLMSWMKIRNQLNIKTFKKLGLIHFVEVD